MEEMAFESLLALWCAKTILKRVTGVKDLVGLSDLNKVSLSENQSWILATRHGCNCSDAFFTSVKEVHISLFI